MQANGKHKYSLLLQWQNKLRTRIKRNNLIAKENERIN